MREPWPIKKILRRGSRIYAFAGVTSLFIPWIEWLEGPRNLKDFPKAMSTDDESCLWIFEKNRLYELTASAPFLLEIGVPCAIGSGRKYAYGALAMGATPKKAVFIASLFDKSTSGPITVVEFEKQFIVSSEDDGKIEDFRDETRQKAAFARAAKLTEGRRKEIAKIANRARWNREDKS